MKTRIAALVFFAATCPNLTQAGDLFSTKENIKARGIDLSFEVPAGMKKRDDESFVQVWVTETQGMRIRIHLLMSKHHMHTHAEKLKALADAEAANGTRTISSERLKIGREPAIIVEHAWTPHPPYNQADKDAKKVEQHDIELSLFPGDTTIKLTCLIGKPDYGGEPLAESIAAVRPALLKMLKSVELN
ncbi:hypothetical protein [Prosthecobacter sp.]|uniref:hypothetical protein n=1 Tax=Prosthecobacter sp. TaxID=1965333 RepID=UPI002AB9E112|nr:hypothetical protein [Prosthecobacter sp.]MDZ4403893.1 hypothetical protein [Prosthecobacter sp.]